MEGWERCELCLGAEAPISSATPQRRAVIRDLFSFWPDDVAVVACSDCFRIIEDFYEFYERVRDNQLILRTTDYPTTSSTSNVKLEDVNVKEEWNDVVVKQENNEKLIDSMGNNNDIVSDDESEVAMIKPQRTRISKKKIKSKDVGDAFSNFPSELIRDGKFVVSKKLLNKMASKFYNIQCGECKDRFDKLSQMLSHFLTMHGGRPFVECCNKKIYQTEFMYQHMAKHLQPSAFQCHICNKEFATIYVLKNHLGYHIPEEERIHRCDQCNKSFAHKALLTRHMDSHVPDSEKKIYNCEHCSKTFNNYYSHFNHVNAVHSAPKYLCPECGKSFRIKSNLSTHLETHNEKKVQCPVCAVMCKTFALRKHMKIHSGVRFNCEQCDYSTPHKCHLQRHMLTKHSDEKPYGCTGCEKRFKLKKNLETHMAQHTGERKYCCPYCPKTFAQSNNFYKHRKRMHDEAYRNSLLAK